MTSQLALALSAPWGDLKLSGRKIKELFYTQVEPPVGADSDLPHFRCRCGKIRIQSLKHGYTNLKQHLMFKHPTWVLEHADEIQATPPNSPKLERTAAAAAAAARAKTKSKATAASPSSKADSPTPATAAAAASPLTSTPPATASAGARKKRKMSNATAVASLDAPAADPDVSEPPAKAPVTRRSRASSLTASTSASSSIVTTATNNGAVDGVAISAAASVQTVKKREDYISWDDYFMSVAFLSAMRSKDPSTQVGACIVNSERKIVGIGYNGFPNGCSDDTLPWARGSEAGDPLETKYPFVCHAEMNAILNKNASDLKGCSIYVALFPCNECAKLIIQSGITHIVYLSDKYHDDWKMVASRRMLDMARIQYRQHHVSKAQITIDFSAIA